MNNQIGEQDGRYQQGETPDLCDQYRAIGIPAISAAALCKSRKPAPAQQGQSLPRGQFFEFED